MADEKQVIVLEWWSPLKPHERHQATGMGRVSKVKD